MQSILRTYVGTSELKRLLFSASEFESRYVRYVLHLEF